MRRPRAGAPLHGWRVFPLQLDDLSSLAYATGNAGAAMVAAARRLLDTPRGGATLRTEAPETEGPVFYR